MGTCLIQFNFILFYLFIANIVTNFAWKTAETQQLHSYNVIFLCLYFFEGTSHKFR